MKQFLKSLLIFLSLLIILYAPTVSALELSNNSNLSYQQKLENFKSIQDAYQNSSSEDNVNQGQKWLTVFIDLVDSYLKLTKDDLNQSESFPIEEKNNFIRLIDGKINQNVSLKTFADGINDRQTLDSAIKEIQGKWYSTQALTKDIKAKLFLIQLKELTSEINNLKQIFLEENEKLSDTFSEKKEIFLKFDEFNEKLKIVASKQENAQKLIESILEDEASALILFNQAKEDFQEAEIALKQSFKILKEVNIELKSVNKRMESSLESSLETDL